MKEDNVLTKVAYIFLGIFSILASVILGIGYFLYINGVSL